MLKKVIERIIIVTVLALALGVFARQSLLRADPPPQISLAVRAKIDPRLLSGNNSEPRAIIIRMKETAAIPARGLLPEDVVARRTVIRDSLQQTAQTSQRDVRQVLAAAESAGQASEVRPLWIVNAIAARAGQDVILSLAVRDDVAFIRPDETITVPPFSPDESGRASSAAEWGVERIGAVAVWDTLGVDGSGVVVANVDTGVDFFHPDLKMHYRGFRSETLPPDNRGNWFDATGTGAVYPVDTNGHGTHTMGTMVGQNGIGVAPGARWIAVRAFNSGGQAQESWLHAAFQWLIAPDGDPALAPDIVNNSWSNSNGASTAFAEDMANLLAAGIMPVFSAGNEGPGAGSVGAPASYSNMLAVGATDSEDFIASFSGRGPSAWGKIKPDVTAPGVNIVSALPGGAYGAYNGTSMAAPHVAGTLALMKQAAPTLSFTDAVQILTGTAVALASPHPNNNYGWGRIDALAAVQMALNAGTVRGQITDDGTGAPIGWASVTFAPLHSGLTATVATDANGDYRRGLVSGDYAATASAFGYTSAAQYGLTVVTGTTITANFALSSLPTGYISGQVTDADTSAPLTATITVDGTPISTPITGGSFSIPLPAGSYTLTVQSWAHEISRATGIPVVVGQNTVQNFALAPAPTILLVDSGAWYNASAIDFYRTALAALNLPFHEWRVKNLLTDSPPQDVLAQHDIVLWSAPFDSPGFVEANNALEDYLSGGGNLMVSGQDVAYFDGGGSLLFYAPYFFNYLYANFLFETETLSVTGTAAPFDGLSLALSGGDGANNQVRPDVIALIEPDFGAQVFQYSGDNSAGQIIGHCKPYRAALLPFGIEAIDTATARANVLSRTISYFQSPRIAIGLDATPAIETRVGDFGETVTHTVRLFNTADGGITETLMLSLGNYTWDTQLISDTLTLAPCESRAVTITVTVPLTAPLDAADTVALVIQSTTHPTLTAHITRTTKAPASLLLVDDDRWYDFEAAFTQSLTANGNHFDVWRVQGDPMLAQGTPPLSILMRYPQIVWFTGYDWFDPLTADEEKTLQTYLDSGGRLAFSSQEYLYQLPEHRADAFAQTYFGVLTHSEILSSTEISGVADNPIGDGFGALPLTFPNGYQNFTDSLTPTATAQPAFMGNSGLPIALTQMGTTTRTWHTAFFAFGPELLTDTHRAAVLKQTAGWLSWLGQSTVTADKTAVAAGDTLTYTAVLKNDGLAPAQTSFTATFPAPLTLLPGSATGGATESGGQVRWNGTISPGTPVTLTYRAKISAPLPYGILAQQVSTITLKNHHITFNRTVHTGINTADWTHSTATAQPLRAALSDTLTFTLQLENSGLSSAPMVTVTGEIPPYLQPLSASGSGNIGTQNGQKLVEWHTPVAQNSAMTLALQTRVISIPFPFSATMTFALDDGFSANNRFSAGAAIIPHQIYMPLVFKE